MASVWTCANGHTHDLSKPLRGLEPDATPGVECKGSGDRVTAMNYDDQSANSRVPVKKWVASSRSQSNAP